MGVHYNNKPAKAVMVKADRETVSNVLGQGRPASQTMADLLASSTAGKTLAVMAKAGAEITARQFDELVGLVVFVFEDHPANSGRKWNVRKDILPRRTQFLRWVAEGTSRVTFSDLSTALKAAYTSPAAYAEACRLMAVETR